MPETGKQIWDKDPLSAAEIEEGLELLKDKGTKEAKAYVTNPLDSKSLGTRRLDEVSDNPDKYATTELKKSVADMVAEEVEPVEDWQVFARNLKLSAEFADLQRELDVAGTFDNFKTIISKLPSHVRTRVIKSYAEWIKNKTKNSQ